MPTGDLREIQRLARDGRHQQAYKLCRDFVEAFPADARAWNLLGSIELGRRRPGEAVEALTRAVKMAPRSVNYHINLAAALGEAGRPEESLAQLHIALELTPNVPELWNNAGVTLEKLNRLRDATEAYRRAINLRPVYAEAHFNLGNVLRKRGDGDGATAAYRQALALAPEHVESLSELAPLLTELGELDEEMACLRAIVRLRPTSPGPRSALLYTLHYSAALDAAALSREHLEWGRLFCEPQTGRIAPHENDRTPERKLRVGYVSPDFREHTVPHFITAALDHHDRANFEVFCYSDAEKPDDITARLSGTVEHWFETRKESDASLAQRIRQARIDILVDLRGHAADNRLPMFCLKPAPIQVNMVGYFDTTGLSTMDYRITDEHMDPAGKGDAALFSPDQYHTEKLVRLAGSCWCYTADEDAPDVAVPPAVKNGYVTFGSLNKIIKVSEPCARMWAAVLEAVPNSRLLLSVVSADAAGTVRKRLESYGLPSDRLTITDKTRTRREYLQRFNDIDIALDTWPFNGITTTCDGLWMGVPCVSMTGGTSVSRAGKSILHAAGLGELAAETPETFVKVASGLAREVDRLAEMRRSMRERLLTSPLMDHHGFARKLESAYREMWRAWCACEQPR